MKTIILCADDYGQNTAISQGIIALVKLQRLSAVSCMTNAGAWLENAAELKSIASQIDVGLHFNLTEGLAASSAFSERYGQRLFTLPTLISKSSLRQLDTEVLAQECLAQLDKFVAGMKALPDFIDGHQHVHQFPQVRDAVLKVYNERLRAQGAYVRWVNEAIGWQDFISPSGWKKAMIYLLGTAAFQKLLQKNQVPHNKSFSGVYDFAINRNYPVLFPQFLQKIADGGLLMCHPGLSGGGKDDVIAESRYKEYQYLASAQFLKDCQEQNVKLVRGKI